MSQRTPAGARSGRTLLTFAVLVARERVERAQLASYCDVEGAPKPSRFMNCWCAADPILDALRDVFARIGETEIRTQVAPWARAVGAQVLVSHELGAARDGDRVEAVGLVIVVIEMPRIVQPSPGLHSNCTGLVRLQVFDVAMVQHVLGIAVVLAALERQATAQRVVEAAVHVALTSMAL